MRKLTKFKAVISLCLTLIILFTTDGIAAIADEPHTAFPLAIKNLKFSPNPNFLPIYIAPTIVTIICIIINNICFKINKVM